VNALLCDADGNLFPSEEPAFEASTEVINELLARHGVEARFDPDDLRRRAAGKNFRATALDLATGFGFALGAAELEEWVQEEKRRVTAHLGAVLAPDPRVIEPLTRLAASYRLAAVSSSALSRLDACFAATDLDGLFPPAARYSAEDSLPVPTSKPDPAVYLHSLDRLGVAAADALAVEDAVPGVQSAVAAGIPVLGNVLFVPPEERGERVGDLLAAGAASVIAAWTDLEEVLRSQAGHTAVTPA
jgi:beta-phosphoglucomutase-like phosphatase (HAD superfamily)